MSDKRETEVKENKEVRDGTKYRKVENKKRRTGITLKRFIILVFVLVLVIGLIIGVRWRILHNIDDKYMKTTLEDNWHYFSDSETTLMNVYRKGNIYKMNVKQKEGEGNLTFWKDVKTGEAYVFIENTPKKYSIDEGGMITNLPGSQVSMTEEKSKVLLAAMPISWIGTDKYDGKDCYVVDIMGNKDYIDKETGLLLATFDDNKQTRSVEYEFYKVTDEDVAKPDLSQYEYVE